MTECYSIANSKSRSPSCSCYVRIIICQSRLTQSQIYAMKLLIWQMNYSLSLSDKRIRNSCTHLNRQPCMFAVLPQGFEKKIIEHQMAIQLELSIMTWVSSDPSSHKIGWGQQQFILNWKWHSQDWAWAILEYTDKLQEALGQTHVSATTVSQQQFSLTCTSTWDSWEIPRDPLMENNPQAWFMGRLVWYRNESYTPTVTATPPHSEVSLMDNERKSYPWAELWAVYWVILFVCKEMSPKVRCGHGQWQVTWLAG